MRPKLPQRTAARTRLLAATAAGTLLLGCAARETQRPGAAADTLRAPAPRPATAAEVLAAARAPGAGAVVVNIWATWCAPCRDEFPDLLRIERIYRERGLRLILVSADFEDQVPRARAFLSRQGVDFPTYLKAGGDMEFIEAIDPRWSGALPATLVLDGQGRKAGFVEGKTTYAALEAIVLPLLDRRNPPGGPS